MSTSPLVIEKKINAPASRIWKALTDKEQMKKWYFDVDDFRPELGFKFSFKGENEGRVFIHHCRVTEVVPEKKISYTWEYEDAPGSSHVTFELFDDNGSTTVRLTHAGLETFPADRPDYARENFVAGWEYIIGKSLKEFVE
jgi:uncharacterized protein YndB with AHSA1/START domain